MYSDLSNTLNVCPVESSQWAERKKIMVVVNHWDSNNRAVGTDSLLRITQKYDFSMVELSSLSGVNLDFLMGHIVDLILDEKVHEECKVSDVISNYHQEVSGMQYPSDLYRCNKEAGEEVRESNNRMLVIPIQLKYPS